MTKTEVLALLEENRDALPLRGGMDPIRERVAMKRGMLRTCSNRIQGRGAVAVTSVFESRC